MHPHQLEIELIFQIYEIMQKGAVSASDTLLSDNDNCIQVLFKQYDSTFNKLDISFDLIVCFQIYE